MGILSVLLIAVSLSMDAFSVSLLYGTLNYSLKKIIITSITVGLFHFFMPLLGLLLGKTIFNLIIIKTKYVLVILYSIIIFEMIKSINDGEVNSNLNFKNILLFALAVSIDSFSVGISFALVKTKIILSVFLFATISFLFTFLGFILGKFINEKTGKFSKIIGAILLTIFVIYIISSN